MNPTLSGGLAALSAELARAVAAAVPSVVYVDAHPRRDASGIAWDEHHLVTVDHAIEREDDIEILLADGASATAKLVGRDPSTDVAILHTQTSLAPLPRTGIEELAVGHIVLALGTRTVRRARASASSARSTVRGGPGAAAKSTASSGRISTSTRASRAARSSTRKAGLSA